MPAANSVGRTVLGVSSGCQAFSRCCLNAVSKAMMSANELSGATADDENSNRTCWLFALVFCHVGGCKILKRWTNTGKEHGWLYEPRKVLRVQF